MSYSGYSIQPDNPKSHDFKELIKKKGRPYAGKEQLRYINRLFQPILTFGSNVKKATVDEYYVYQVDILRKIFTISRYHRPDLISHFKITQTNHDIIKFYFCPSDYVPGHFYLCFKYQIKKKSYVYSLYGETHYDISYNYGDIIPQKCPDGNVRYYFAYQYENFYPQITGRRKLVNMNLKVITDGDIHFKNEINRIETERKERENELKEKKKRDAIFRREQKEKEKQRIKELEKSIKESNELHKKKEKERKAKKKAQEKEENKKEKEEKKNEVKSTEPEKKKTHQWYHN